MKKLGFQLTEWDLMTATEQVDTVMNVTRWEVLCLCSLEGRFDPQCSLHNPPTHNNRAN